MIWWIWMAIVHVGAITLMIMLYKVDGFNEQLEREIVRLESENRKLKSDAQRWRKEYQND